MTVSNAEMNSVELRIEESGRRLEGWLKKAAAGKQFSLVNLQFLLSDRTCVSNQGCLNVALMMFRPMVMLSLNEK